MINKNTIMKFNIEIRNQNNEDDNKDKNVILIKENYTRKLILKHFNTLLIAIILIIINCPRESKQIIREFNSHNFHKIFRENERIRNFFNFDKKNSFVDLINIDDNKSLLSSNEELINNNKNETLISEDESLNLELNNNNNNNRTTLSIGNDESVNYCEYQSISFRLPSEILKPTHYDLIIMPDLNLANYEGAVQVNLKILNKTNVIVLHSDDSLNVEEVFYLDLGFNEFNEFNRSIGAAAADDDFELNNNKNFVSIKQVCRDYEKQQLIIILNRELQLNSFGLLHLTFANDLSDNLRGFYKSSYVNYNNTSSSRRFHAVTQFQATEARKVFPCFDEPKFKTTFDLTLIVSPSDRLILANTKPIFEKLLKPNKERNLPERKLVKFSTTPPMSTYLLAFIIGEFDFVENILTIPATTATSKSIINKETIEKNFLFNKEERKIKLRVYTPLGKKEFGKFALDVASRALIELENYFKIEYPLEKLDLISIADFEAGAMENWGLITFKSKQLLVDDENTSIDTKALIAGTIVHELAHQWFGNLVTMNWWNDLWLNEGFATWLEYKITDKLFPKFEYNFYYLLNSHIHALNEDSFRFVHAVEYQDLLENSEDIDQIFDAISYNKAAAIIKILHDDIYPSFELIMNNNNLNDNNNNNEEEEELDEDEEKLFKKDLRVYLNKNKFNSTSMSDLWNSMINENFDSNNSIIVNNLTTTTTTTTKVNIKSFMESWLTQSGHPLLIVDYNNLTNELEIEQERFVSGVQKLTLNESKQIWIIPISIVLFSSKQNKQNNQVLRFIMNEKKIKIKLPNWWHESFNNNDNNENKISSWLKLNSNFSGFYRVLYNNFELFKLMKQAIEKKLMLPEDRLNLLDEAHTLVISNKLTTNRLLELISWYSNENNGAVIDVLVGAFNGLLRLYAANDDSKMALNLIKYGKKLFGKIYENNYVLDDDDDDDEKNLTHYFGKSSLISALIYLNHTKVVDNSLKIFNKSIDDGYGDGDGKLTKKGMIKEIDLRKAHYMAVSKYGSDYQFEKLFYLFNKTDSSEEKIRLANAMAKSNQLNRLELFWFWLKELNNDELEDKFEILSNFLTTKVGRNFVLKLLTFNMQDLISLNNEKPINSLIEELSLSLDRNDLKKLNYLFIKHKTNSSWQSSLYYIKKMLNWQKVTRESGLELMENLLEKLLNS